MVYIISFIRYYLGSAYFNYVLSVIATIRRNYIS